VTSSALFDAADKLSRLIKFCMFCIASARDFDGLPHRVFATRTTCASDRLDRDASALFNSLGVLMDVRILEAMYCVVILNM
jgi:hypothetical protein